jgi:hypothetical protein
MCIGWPRHSQAVEGLALTFLQGSVVLLPEGSLRIALEVEKVSEGLLEAPHSVNDGINPGDDVVFGKQEFAGQARGCGRVRPSVVRYRKATGRANDPVKGCSGAFIALEGGKAGESAQHLFRPFWQGWFIRDRAYDFI